MPRPTPRSALARQLLRGRCSRTARWGRRARSPTCAPTAPPSGRPRRARIGSATCHRRVRRRAGRQAARDLPGRRRLLRHERPRRCRGRCRAALARPIGKPVRVQWSREDEHRLGPEGPAAVARAARARSTPTDASPPGKRDVGAMATAQPAESFSCSARSTPAWPAARASRRPDLAERRSAVRGAPTSRCSRTGSRTRRCGRRTSARRARWPTCFAVEASSTSWPPKPKIDPLEFRLRDLPDPRGIEVLKRARGADQLATAPLSRAGEPRRHGARPRHRLRALQAQRDLRARSPWTWRSTSPAARSRCCRSPARTTAA